jgi:hypothetical protein
MQEHPLSHVQRLVDGLGLHPGALPGVKAALLHILYAVRSDAALADHLANNVRFQAFVGHEAAGWGPAEYGSARDMVLRDGVRAPLVVALRALEAANGLMDRPPFTPDRRQVDAWAPPGTLDFPDIAKLNNRQVQALLKRVDMRELSVALKDAPPEVMTKIYVNLSTRMRKIVAQELTYLDRARPQDVAEVRGLIGRTMRQMAMRGELEP